MSGEQKNIDNMHEKVFIVSAIVFNLLVSAVYISTKFDNMELVKTLGYPFSYCLTKS
jgi:cell division protein FtsL